MGFGKTRAGQVADLDCSGQLFNVVVTVLSGCAHCVLSHMYS